jgi:hypothetical protein
MVALGRYEGLEGIKSGSIIPRIEGILGRGIRSGRSGASSLGHTTPLHKGAICELSYGGSSSRMPVWSHGFRAGSIGIDRRGGAISRGQALPKTPRKHGKNEKKCENKLPGQDSNLD